jgi:LAO/AO transport system kinase
VARRELTLDDYVSGVTSADRTVLARAITLVESARPEHHALAIELMERLMPAAGTAHRIGVSGVPGVGKSTFLEAFGMARIDEGRRVAVLAVDPSSGVSGGSILGDKTRMGRLASHPSAFIRPSPTGGGLGGVHHATQQAILLCEAAGYDLIFVETVGVGQSETEVGDMVDTFLVLMLTGAGDDLQGIKRGILELADVLAVTKADGDNRTAALLAQRELSGALRLLRGESAPHVATCSAVTGEGLQELWSMIDQRYQDLHAAGGLTERRSEQRARWLRRLVHDEILRAFWDTKGARQYLERAETAARQGDRSAPALAAELVASVFGLRS